MERNIALWLTIKYVLTSRTLRILTSLLLFLPLCAQELPFTHYTTGNEVNPLPSTDVRSVYQDRLGYMWFMVFSSGLLRYNGRSYVRYTADDGLPGLDVREVTEDMLGRLWVASEEGISVSEKPLNDYEEIGKIRFISRIGSVELFNSAIVEHRLLADYEGNVWVGTREHGIIRYHNIGIDSVRIDTIKTNEQNREVNRDIRSFIVRKDSSVWVGVGGGDILRFIRGSSKFTTLNEQEGIPRINTDVLYESPSGILYGGCLNGLLWKMNEKKGQNSIEVLSKDLTSRITSILEVSPGMLWVGSEGNGILALSVGSSTLYTSSRQRTVYTTRNGLLSENVSSLFQDREKNLWITQIGGISKLRSNFAAFVNYSAGTRNVHGKLYLPNPQVNIVIPPSKQRSLDGSWIGTTGGGVALISPGDEVEYLQTDHGLRNNWINGLAVDSKERLWIGTVSGINCLSMNQAYPPPTSSQMRMITFSNRRAQLASYEKTTIYASQNIVIPEGTVQGKTVESIWLLGYQHLYCVVDNTWYVFQTLAGLPATNFDAILRDDKGYIWIGTRDAGLYRSTYPLTLKKLRELRMEDYQSNLENDDRKLGKEVVERVFERKWSETYGAPSNQMEMMAWRDGVLWVGTPEGLVALEKDTLQITSHFTKADGLRGNDVTGLAFSPTTGSLWVGTNAGLAEIDPKARKVLRTVTKHDGLVDDEVWFYGSVAAGNDGTVYFGTAKGLSVYVPQFDKRNAAQPIIRFQHSMIKEEASGDNEVLFEYAALSFADEKLVQYKTRLLGYDKDWSPENTDVSIRYTNLSAFFIPKRYTFEVVACNNDRVWTDKPLQFSFQIQPPWWFRWWWLSSNVVLLGVIVYSYSRYRIKRLEERSRQLEKIVEERTQEITVKADQIRSQAEQLGVQNQELEEKNREIVRTQEQLIMQEKLASLGALTAGIAHEIKNPLNFVNNFAELSVELMQELREDLALQKDRLDGKTYSRVEDTLIDLEHNAKKINEHGKRADSIVRGMLLHSRGKSGERMSTDINQLLEEYVNLAYHGLRAQDPTFNITIETDYDKSITPIEIIPQDLSRVFLNIVNNGCYASNERKKMAGSSFSPKITVSTKNLGDRIEVRIRDNGTGIPKEIIDKIFDPFFTTKPTGKGTGLGLSMSYDIVVKEHNGEIKVESKPGEFTEFIIRLPKNQKR